MNFVALKGPFQVHLVWQQCWRFYDVKEHSSRNYQWSFPPAGGRKWVWRGVSWVSWKGFLPSRLLATANHGVCVCVCVCVCLSVCLSVLYSWCVCVCVSVCLSVYLSYIPGQLMQFCLSFSSPMDCNPPGSSVHGILQARILERVTIPFSRGSSRSRDQTHRPTSPALQADSLPSEPPGKFCINGVRAS